MNTCSYCDEPSVTSWMVRVGKLPSPYHDPKKEKDHSRLVVVRACKAHADRRLPPVESVYSPAA